MTSIQVEDLSNVKKKVTFEVPQEKVLEVVDSEYKDLKKTTQIKGFRRGKVPLVILRSYFKDRVAAEAARRIIEETLQPGLDEKNLKPLAVSSIDPGTLEEGKPFTFSAEIEVPPHIEVKNYKGLKLKKHVRSVTPEQIDERLQYLRERNARLAQIPESRGIAQGDHVLVDIEATVDGENAAALTVTDYNMEMGRNFYLPGFDSLIEGMRPDQTKEVTLDLPEDFPRKALAGKTANCRVTVREAKEKILPELDDDFAKDQGEFENLEALRAAIEKDLQQAYSGIIDRELETQIFDALISENPFDVPETMIEEEIDNFLEHSIRSLVAQGHDPQRLPMPTQAYRDQARPTATQGVQKILLYRAMAEQESLSVSEEEFDEALTKQAESLGITLDFLRDQLDKDERTEGVRQSLLYRKVFELILANAEITEEEPPSTEPSAFGETEKE